MAAVTGVQSNKIVSKVKRIGGGFGGKETRSIQLAAICAVAAPLSHNPLIREEPVRESGEKFAQAALRELLDADGRPLISTLEAAQALVLIQAYEVYRNGNMDGYMPYFGK